MSAKQIGPEQQALIEAPHTGGEILFLSGPAGAGKSDLLAARLVHLLEQGVPAYAILVLLPDRPAREGLRQALREIPLGPYGSLSLHTYYSLAQRMVAIFWPLWGIGLWLLWWRGARLQRKAENPLQGLLEQSTTAGPQLPKRGGRWFGLLTRIVGRRKRR